MCFDLEVIWQSAFAYPRYIEPESAWEVVASLRPEISGATAYIAGAGGWRSFAANEVAELCSLVAEAEKVVTYNGKSWDVPILGLLVTDINIQGKLRKISIEDAENRHDYLWEIVKKLRGGNASRLWDVGVWNFGEQRMNQWLGGDLDAYQATLMSRGWARQPAFCAAKAWKDVTVTHKLWKRWRAGKMVVQPRSEPTSGLAFPPT